MRKLLYICIIILYCSVAHAQTYKTRYNPFTRKQDWIVNLYITAPSGPSSTCTSGNMAYDNDYVYVCTGTDTWGRVTIAAWAVTDVMLLSGGVDKVLLSDGTSNILIRP